MTDLVQLVFELDLAGAHETAPGIKRNVAGGAPRLLRRLLAIGMDPGAIETAAALVAALDEEPLT